MKYVRQFAVVLTVSFMGEVLKALIPLQIPASIYGIVLLFLALEFKIVKISDIRETSTFLIAVMPIMFLPPAVGVIDSWDMVKVSWLPYVAVTLISTIAVMGITGVITQAVIRKGRKEK